MTAKLRSDAVKSADGTTIGFTTLGDGDGVIVVGGSMTTGADYTHLGEALASSFTVHLVDRRGRGRSGPQGAGYSIEKECEDLLAVMDATGARNVFGHSFGGLVALETGLRSSAIERIAAWDPGVSVNGSIPSGWVQRCSELLAGGDNRAAFALFVKSLGPKPIRTLPLWYLKIVLRLAIREPQWTHMAPLLEPALAEHAESVRLDGAADRYASICIPVLLLGGAKSPSSATGGLVPLHDTISGSTLRVIDGLDHFAPDEKAPERVAELLRGFFA